MNQNREERKLYVKAEPTDVTVHRLINQRRKELKKKFRSSNDYVPELIVSSSFIVIDIEASSSSTHNHLSPPRSSSRNLIS